MKVYCVYSFNRGHDPDALLAVYSTERKAEEAIKRLEAKDKYNSHEFIYDEVEVDEDPAEGTY